MKEKDDNNLPIEHQNILIKEIHNLHNELDLQLQVEQKPFSKKKKKKKKISKIFFLFLLFFFLKKCKLPLNS